MTAVAKGTPMTTTYAALPIARGSMARTVVMAVIRMGLTRTCPAVTRARPSL